MKLLFIADLVGNDAVETLVDLLPRIKNRYKIDFTIVNCENADKGKGVTRKQVATLKQAGVNVLTSGNHIWDPRKKDILNDHTNFLIRPLNYPEGNAGAGSTVVSDAEGKFKIGVINVQGRSFMYSIDCPFTAAEQEARRLRTEADIIFVDIHAEASAEKVALGWHLDGKVTAVIGTHTHVQTADERILPGGTAYLTDAGMTGPEDSVIGMETTRAIKRFILQSHVFYTVASGNIRINGVIVTANPQTGKATAIERINFDRKGFTDAGPNH